LTVDCITDKVRRKHKTWYSGTLSTVLCRTQKR